MSSTINFVPPRVPLVDPKTGIVTREWYLFLLGVFQRIGGATGPSTPDLSNSLFEDAGSGETNSVLFSLDQAVGQQPLFPELSATYEDQSPAPQAAGTVDDLRAEVAALREQLCVAETTLNDLKQSILL